MLSLTVAAGNQRNDSKFDWFMYTVSSHGLDDPGFWFAAHLPDNPRYAEFPSIMEKISSEDRYSAIWIQV
jgi:hypothetical protein